MCMSYAVFLVITLCTILTLIIVEVLRVQLAIVLASIVLVDQHLIMQLSRSLDYPLVNSCICMVHVTYVWGLQVRIMQLLLKIILLHLVDFFLFCILFLLLLN
jgi:hypothetical protein